MAAPSRTSATPGTAMTGPLIINGDGVVALPAEDLDLAEISDSGADEDINANFTALEDAVNAILSRLGDVE